MSAFNDVGESAESDPLSIMAAAVPDVPLLPTLVSQSATTIEIAWVEPYDGGTPVTNYKIWWDNASGGLPATFVEKIGSTGNVLTFEIDSGIITDSVYQISVKAVNVIGGSDLSPAITVRAASVPVAPAAPTKNSVVHADATTTAITIDWLAPTYDGGNDVTGYSVYMDDGLGGAFVL